MSRIFSLFFIIFFSTISAYGTEPSPYLVEGVSVNVSAKNPSAARIAAISGARRDAFLILLTRLEMKINIADNISDEEISDMVRSEQIDEEKIAGNNYSATFNIMFAKNFVDHILTQKNLIKSNENSNKSQEQERYLLIPVKVYKQQTSLWEESNDWKKAVEKVLTYKSQDKFLIPDPDVTNIATLNRDNINTATYSTLEPLLTRYHSEAAYILFFDYDENASKVVINISYIRKLQKKPIKLSFVNVDRLKYEDLINKVAEKTIDYLFSSQNSQNQILNSNLVRIKVRINNFGNWLMVKNRIENSNLVNQLNIESISRDYALISVSYIDPKNSIEDSFAKIGLSLKKENDNFYTINTN